MYRFAVLAEDRGKGSLGHMCDSEGGLVKAHGGSGDVDQGGLGRLGDVPPMQILDGRYRLDEVLGVGGMSVVWKATDDVLGRAVAVKILAGDFAFDPDARAAVLAEAQAVAQLSHPNICNVFDYGESLQADGHMVPYVVMELLTGPSLADRLEEGPLAPQEALKVAAEVAAGLAAAHAHGVVHRDVKPGNVILTSSGAKVFDFGIAAIAGAPDVAGPTAASSPPCPMWLPNGSGAAPSSRHRTCSAGASCCSVCSPAGCPGHPGRRSRTGCPRPRPSRSYPASPERSVTCI